VLAMAGAPVRRADPALTRCMSAIIRVNDSLHEGSSRFYAESTRLVRFPAWLIANHRCCFLLGRAPQGNHPKTGSTVAEGIVHNAFRGGRVRSACVTKLTLPSALNRYRVASALHAAHVAFQDDLS